MPEPTATPTHATGQIPGKWRPVYVMLAFVALLLTLAVWAVNRRYASVECVDPFPKMRYGGPYGCFVLDRWTGRVYFDQPIRMPAQAAGH